jgi:hypothetical protein
MAPTRGYIYSTQNPRHSLDVNDDGFISPIDSLLVINQINAGPSAAAAQTASPFAAALSLSLPSSPFLDTSGDGLVSPVDALMVINYINSHTDRGEGEFALSLPSAPAFQPTSLSSTFNDDLTWLDLLAEDVEKARRKNK